MDTCTAGSIINNELDCPLLEESEVVSFISIDSVVEMQRNIAACMQKTINVFNIYCMHNIHLLVQSFCS